MKRIEWIRKSLGEWKDEDDQRRVRRRRSVRSKSFGYAFLDPHYIVFGTDYPFGSEKGEMFFRENLKAVKKMDISKEEMSGILEKTAKKLLRIT